MIPFSKTTLGNEEIGAVKKVIEGGWVVLGEKSREFEKLFAEYVGAKHAVFVDSGTSALFLALKYLKKRYTFSSIKVPSLTFVATAESAVNAGFDIQFSDIGDDLCLEDAYLHSLPVNLGGHKAKEGALIYDSAHRIEKDDVKDSKALWCYSLYATKNITTVTGGMIATNDTEAYEWLLKARDHGLSLGTKERYQGRYKQYDVDFVGWRVKGDDFRAVVGIEQLKKLPEITKRRNEIVARYNKELKPEFRINNWSGNHLYPILVEDRAKFMDYMFDNEIQCAVHFRPIHTMKGYEKFYSGEDLSKTEYIGERIVSLPLFPQMTEEEQTHIINKVNDYV